jgi:hypothetical protein
MRWVPLLGRHQDVDAEDPRMTSQPFRRNETASDGTPLSWSSHFSGARS